VLTSGRLPSMWFASRNHPYGTSMPQSGRRPQHQKQTLNQVRVMSALPPKADRLKRSSKINVQFLRKSLSRSDFVRTVSLPGHPPLRCRSNRGSHAKRRRNLTAGNCPLKASSADHRLKVVRVCSR
jgi:hypothetical protein